MLKVAVSLPTVKVGCVNEIEGSLQVTLIENPAIALALNLIVPVALVPPNKVEGATVIV